MSGEVARTIQQMLLAVVQEGTATKADLATFEVAGKSGTARRTSQNAGYTAGNYTASFVGLFPGNDPQYVVLVKLDSPKGAHYAGGDIAAPVTQIVLRAALAARDAALDREGLAASEKSTLAEAAASGSNATRSTAAPNVARRVRGDATDRLDRTAYDPSDNMTPRTEPEETAPYFVDLPASPKLAVAPRLPITPRPIPDVRRLSVREAVRALHGAGFRVRVVTAASSGTLPAAGTMAAPGTLIQLTRPLE
jgi:membrane peptidoglycan carboxypeptidase